MATSRTTMLQDLYDHGDWANEKLFALCEDLTDQQLDQSREMGFGSLRNTLFHVLEAEEIWLERYHGKPPRALVPDAGTLSPADILAQLQLTAAQRNQLIQDDATSDTGRIVAFQDLAGNNWEFPIGDLLNHVSNHGIHHRAQVLSFLKQFGKTIPGGVDYIFWKIARPSCDIPADSTAALKQYGLEVATQPGKQLLWDTQRAKQYYAYGDWAMAQVLTAAGPLSDAQLDQPIDMGMGSLRKNLEHIVDAERWWLLNWDQDNSPFPSGEAPRSPAQLGDQLRDIIEMRTAFIDQLDSDSAGRIVSVSGKGPPLGFRVSESLLQLCGHGTHHRAQSLNMLRQLGAATPQVDLVQWLRVGSGT